MNYQFGLSNLIQRKIDRIEINRDMALSVRGSGRIPIGNVWRPGSIFVSGIMFYFQYVNSF